ncbi:MAG: helix-turn-helix domain-containing protein [Candidatus Omnitrophica bacterium]|nr:helix-turn-helix domain-containing protein [Candidatus Omnitrophota bacterium]
MNPPGKKSAIQNPPKHLSIAQYAKKLGISRIAVYKKVKKGQIPAVRIGRSYVIYSSQSEIIKEQKSKKQAPYISVAELAKEHGISRVTAYKRVKEGHFSAKKSGRRYIVSTLPTSEIISTEKQTISKHKTMKSLPTLAKGMRSSRVTVYKMVKNGEIDAVKVGKNFVTGISEGQYVSIPEFAKMIGISRIAVYKKVIKGQIKAVKIGGDYMISKKMITNLLKKKAHEI